MKHGSIVAALTAIGARSVHLVITDVYMRGMDGLGLVQALRSSPLAAAVPILVVSGGHSDEEAAARRAGASAFLQKPFRMPQLLAAVATLLGLPPRAS